MILLLFDFCFRKFISDSQRFFENSQKINKKVYCQTCAISLRRRLVKSPHVQTTKGKKDLFCRKIVEIDLYIFSLPIVCSILTLNRLSSLLATRVLWLRAILRGVMRGICDGYPPSARILARLRRCLWPPNPILGKRR